MTQGFGPPQGSPPPWQMPAGAPPQQTPQAAPAPQAAPQAWGQPTAAPTPQAAPQAAPQAWGRPTAAGQFPPQQFAPTSPAPAQGFAGGAPQFSGGNPFGPQVNPLDGVGDANVFSNSAYFPIGSFLVQIEEIKGIVSRNPAKAGAVMIVVECSILQSNVAGMAPGNRCAQVIKMAGYGKADMKVLCTALNGGQPGNKDHEAYCNQMGYYSANYILHLCSPAQPMRGKKLPLQTVFKANKNPALAAQGKGFTNHNWGPVQP